MKNLILIQLPLLFGLFSLVTACGSDGPSNTTPATFNNESSALQNTSCLPPQKEFQGSCLLQSTATTSCTEFYGYHPESIDRFAEECEARALYQFTSEYCPTENRVAGVMREEVRNDQGTNIKVQFFYGTDGTAWTIADALNEANDEHSRLESENNLDSGISHDLCTE